jgi:hypothetical protein
VGLRKEKKRRHEVQMDHGFRKVFDNETNDRVDKVYVEMLIGHRSHVQDPRGAVDLNTSRHYDRRLPLPVVRQYLKAMPYLSVDEGYRGEAVLQEKLEEVQKAKDEDVRDLRFQLLEEKQKTRDLADKMDQIVPLVDELRRRAVSKDAPPPRR